MNISLRGHRAVLGLLTLLTALVCALVLSPGSALAAANVPVASTTTADFGSVQVGSSSATRTVTFTNDGTVDVSYNSGSTSWAGASQDFQVQSDTCATGTLTPGSSCTVTLIYQPSQAGSETAEYFEGFVDADGLDSAQRIDLSGTGLQPAISTAWADSGTGDFGDVQQSSWRFRTLAVTNTGNAPLNIIGISSAPNYTFMTNFAESNVCSTAAPLAPGASCNVIVDYQPTALGEQDGTLTIDSNDPNTPTTTISLKGTGQTDAYANLVGNPTFAPATVNVGSSETTFTFTDGGQYELQLGQATITGANASEFSIVPGKDSCSNSTVPGTPAGATCTITVKFAPTASDAQNATLNVPEPYTFWGTATVDLTAVGLTPAVLSVNSGTQSFGSVTTGQSSTTTTVTVKDTGGSPLNIAKASIAGQNAGQFAIVPGSDKCSGATVAPGASCTVEIRFTPTATGAASAELDITPAGSTTPTVIKLSGVGAAVSQPTEPTQPTQPVQPTQPTQPVQPTHPTQPVQPKLVERVASEGHPNAQQLLAHGEKVRVYCNRACSLKVGLQVYYRAIVRGTHYAQEVHAFLARKPQPWTRVTVGQKTVKLAHGGYTTVTVNVSSHKQTVKDAGSILLGVYMHDGKTLVSKKWMQVKGQNMKALVAALNRDKN